MITKSHSIKILLCLAFVALPALAQKKRAPVAKRPVVAASSQQFEEAAAKANQAREAGKLDEAITLYKKAISFSQNGAKAGGIWQRCFTKKINIPKPSKPSIMPPR